MRRLRLTFTLSFALVFAAAVAVHVAMPPLVGMAIAMPAGDGVTVPSSALRGGHIWVVEKETAYQRAVKTAPRAPGQLLVSEGVAPGEAVVIDPPARLVNGGPLRLTP
ncbi:hypothetical protein IAI18_03120 [Acetobacteraceae bacterium H6797]|nr:hypothetical protein [Acetobacteraceae bacterium H6797]